MAERGKLIAFEGGEACGKSTQAKILAKRLSKTLYPEALYTWEPGFTELGNEIRKLLLDPNTDIAPRAEALLMAADRAQHVAVTIDPLLDVGRWVVTDRYLYSTLAYQGAGRGLNISALKYLSYFAGAREADVVVYLPMAEIEQQRRLAAQPDRLDRFEKEGPEFHARVNNAFAEMAYKDDTLIGDISRTKWIVVGGVGETEVIAQSIWDQLAKLFPILSM